MAERKEKKRQRETKPQHREQMESSVQRRCSSVSMLLQNQVKQKNNENRKHRRVTCFSL